MYADGADFVHRPHTCRTVTLIENPCTSSLAIRLQEFSLDASRSFTGMARDVVIRPARGAEEFPSLVNIWRSAVVATHDFLAEKHRVEIEERLATMYLPNVNLVVADLDGQPVGFAGTDSGKLEMLFVDAESRGSGIGTELLEYVIAAHKVRSVDVNEQNGQAVGFYAHAGFVVAGRSPVDGDGLPYPLLHMTFGC